MSKFYEPLHIPRSVKRQIAYDVGTFIILPYLVARRREKGLQYLILRMCTANLFYQGTTLFKFAQRCSVKP